MDIGICGPTPSQMLASRLIDEGCAYYEPSMSRSIMQAEPAVFDRTHLSTAGIDAWSVDGLSPRAAGNLMPGELPAVGVDCDMAAIEEYLAEALRRATMLGVDTVVFGSGAARRVPKSFPVARAREQFAEVLRMAVGLAGSGIAICAEHVTRSETNFINSVAEAAAMVNEFQIKGLLLTIDLYHLTEESEPSSVVRDVRDMVGHVHVCGAVARRAPQIGDEGFLLPLFDQLADIGYTGRCSIECRWQDIEREGPPAVAAVRRAAELAGLAW